MLKQIIPSFGYDDVSSAPWWLCESDDKRLRCMRERDATCGREAKSTVFAKDMAEGTGICVVVFRRSKSLRDYPITCYVPRMRVI